MQENRRREDRGERDRIAKVVYTGAANPPKRRALVKDAEKPVHYEGVIPKAGVFQPAEGSCAGYSSFLAREIPHYA